MKLHSAGSSSGRGGLRKPPLAFPERGAVMAAAVPNTPVAVAASLAVVRAFVSEIRYDRLGGRNVLRLRI